MNSRTYKGQLSLSSIAVFMAGAITALITVWTTSPSVTWQTCRDMGISTATQTCPAPQACPAHTPTFETFPAPDDDARRVRVNGTYNKPSPFRGPPSPAVDSAWEAYWKVWIFGVDEDMFHASQPEHPEAAVRLDDGRYLGTFEATHQLHCLYNLFRASYLDRYPSERASYDEDPELWHERVDHCTEILRQKLECDRDTSLMTYNWVKGKSSPTLNFNTARMCRDWKILDRWAAEHEANDMPTKPVGAVELDVIP